MLVDREPSIRDVLFDERGNLVEIISTCLRDGRVESFTCLYHNLKVLKDYSLDNYSVIYKYKVEQDAETGNPIGISKIGFITRKQVH